MISVDNLIKLKKDISDEWVYVNSIINENQIGLSSELFETCVKCNNSLTTDSTSGRLLRGRKGIYIFLITDPINLSAQDVKRYNSIASARLHEGELCGLDIIEGECLYTGSCISNSLFTRINDHFSSNTSKSSLKLKTQQRRIFLGKATAYVFPIKKEYEEFLKIIVPMLETCMHKQFVPLAGSPRT